MDDEPTFRADLYRGTAPFYDRYRLLYPDALVRDLLRRAHVSGNGRLLDLACGTGQIALALRDHFTEVWAVDQEPELVELARNKAATAGVRNVRWIEGRAEDVDPEATFDLVTAGNAFHRLRRSRVADLAMHWLPSGGHLALLWSSGPLDGSAPWQRVLADVTRRWTRLIGSADRVPSTWDQHIAERPHTSVLRAAGFHIVGRYNFLEVHEWSLATLVGFVYSTSFLPRAVLGDRSAAFETDMRDRLLAAEPSGVFRDEVSFSYDLASRT
ncbi:MAG: class I SAM-dependent methyltransferase [Acidimicrobiia bacterium]